MDNPEEKLSAKTTKEKTALFFASVFVFMGFVAAGYGLYITASQGGFSISNLASFGSYAQGAVASLWSLAALLFLYATLLAQRQQISQQESQLEQQKIQFEKEQTRQEAESKQQEERFQSQQKAIELQSFENSFFQLLALFKATRHEVTFNYEGTGVITPHEGLECFPSIKNIIHAVYQNSTLHQLSHESPPALTKIENAARDFYAGFYMPYREGLSQYFRVLYHAIKFVDASTVLTSDTERRRYTSLVRAQLTDNELFLIFYNGISPNAEKFRALIEKYGMLEHLDRKLLLHGTHVDFYSKAYE